MKKKFPIIVSIIFAIIASLSVMVKPANVLGNKQFFQVQNESADNIIHYSTSISNANTATQLSNNVVLIKFSDESDQFNTSSYYTNNSNAYKTYYNAINECLNLSENSLKKYITAISNGRANVNTTLVSNSNTAITVNKTRNFYMPYQPNNATGYFEYELDYISSASNVSKDYSISETGIVNRVMYTTFKSHVYLCSKSGGNGACDTDESDKIICKCHADTYCTNSRYICEAHPDRVLREMNLVNKILNDNASKFTGDLDANDDGYIDSVVFLLQDDPYLNSTTSYVRSVGWGELLWAHQYENVASYFEEISGTLAFFGIDIESILTSRYNNHYSTDDFYFLDNSAVINNAELLKYNLLDLTHLCNEYQYYESSTYGKVPSSSTLCHEFLHTLGYPDLYCYQDEYDTPVGSWDAMASNHYGVIQYPNSYSRYKMGWIDEQNVVNITKNGTYSLKSVAYEEENNVSLSSRPVIYTLKSEDYPDQLIVLEYRAQEGEFDGGYYTTDSGSKSYAISKPGLIIYRIDLGIEATPGYNSEVFVGNEGGTPYGMYVYRTLLDGLGYASLNNSNTTYGSSNKSVIYDTITFQVYNDDNGSLDQGDINSSSVSYVNSGIVISNVSISNNEIFFKVEWDQLESAEDTTAPVITLNGSKTITVYKGKTYIEPGATAYDAVDGTVTVSITGTVNTSVAGTYFVTYTATDKSSNIATTTRTVIVKADIDKPVITLNGSDTIVMYVGDTYTELGATAYDENDGNLTVTITGTVNNMVSNSYPIVYSATDAAGNKATKTRMVIVQKRPVTDTTAPVITLNGNETITLSVGDTYTEPGATAQDETDGTVTVSTTGTVNTNIAGTYTITYTATDAAGNTATKTRTVIIEELVIPDTTAPVITLIGSETITLSVGDAYTELGATAIDETDGNINVTWSGEVDIYIAGTYTITYIATDAAGNTATKTRTVIVQETSVPDTIAPVITLIGSETITLSVGDAYTELGATAIDETDGNINVTWSGEVDIYIAGTYTITYTATDAAGNTATKTRTVIVQETSVPDTIAPVITLIGDENVTLFVGDTYYELGATSQDEIDGSVVVARSGSVNTSLAGTYTITYTATDSSGNTATKTRIVEVKYNILIQHNKEDKETINVNEEVIITVSVENVSSPLTYKLYVNGDLISQNSTGHFKVTPTNSGEYKCYVVCENSMSQIITLNVKANSNNSGALIMLVIVVVIILFIVIAIFKSKKRYN